MSKRKSKVSEASQESRSVIDVSVPFPEESAHLVEDGVLRIVFDSYTRDLIIDISSELVMSRKLPVDVQEVDISDPMTLWVAAKRQSELSDDGSDAIMAARHIYSQQIQLTNHEAMVLALTAYTEIKDMKDPKTGKVIEPETEKDGKLFSSEGNRSSSSFVRLVQQRAKDIPKVNRNLKNPYEARMQWLDQTLNEAGYEFYNKAVSEINAAVMAIVGGLEETDDDGFHSETTGSEGNVHDDAQGESA